jgi:hypothetical protein
MPNLNYATRIVWILIPLGMINGCDDRATRIAIDAADRQAQQNTAMAEVNKEVATGTHKLVEADAQARKEIVGVHRDLQAERTRLDSGWGELEGERRQIARQRRTESLFATMTPLVGGILLTAMLLGFCWFVLVGACRDAPDAELNELLVREILIEEPTLVHEGSHPMLSHTEVENRREGD